MKIWQKILQIYFKFELKYYLWGSEHFLIYSSLKLFYSRLNFDSF